MNKINALREAASRGYLRAGATVGLGLASLGAFAQTVDPFDTALANAQTKVETYAAALVTLAAVAVVFMIAVKYVKKIPRAS